MGERCVSKSMTLNYVIMWGSRCVFRWHLSRNLYRSGLQTNSTFRDTLTFPLPLAGNAVKKYQCIPACRLSHLEFFICSNHSEKETARWAFLCVGRRNASQLVLKIIAITMTAFMRGIFALCAQLGEKSLYKWNTLGSRRDNVVYEEPKKCQRSNGGVAFSSGSFSGACGCFCVTWNHTKIWYAQRRPCCWNSMMLIKYFTLTAKHFKTAYTWDFAKYLKYSLTKQNAVWKYVQMRAFRRNS